MYLLMLQQSEGLQLNAKEGVFCNHFFTNRVIYCWNKLLEEVVSAPILNTFMKKLRHRPKETIQPRIPSK